MSNEWTALSAHPIIQSVAVPLMVAIIVTGAMRLRGERFGGHRGAGLAIGLGFLASGWLLVGAPLALPLSAVHKLTLLCMAGLVLGAMLELPAASAAVTRVLAVVLFAGAALWLAWPHLQRDTLDWTVTAVAVVCCILLYLLGANAERRADDGLSLLLAAGGVAGVAVVSGSLVIAQLATAVAVAAVGFMVWNWPQPRDTLGATALLGVAVPVLSLALMTVLLTPAPSWALAPLTLVFFIPPLASRLRLPGGRWREPLQPLIVLAIGCIPIALAIALALLGDTPDDAYYL